MSFANLNEIDSEIEGILSRISEVIKSIRAKISSPILINNFPNIFRPALGILDVQNEVSFINSINRLNHKIVQVAESIPDVYIVDYMNLFSMIGTENFFDIRNWQIAQAPLAKKALVPLGREYGNFFRALNGKTKKCLVLDCDNTLWGGVVGEDLSEGINLNTSYPGSSYRSFQEEILNLHDRGVMNLQVVAQGYITLQTIWPRDQISQIASEPGGRNKIYQELKRVDASSGLVALWLEIDSDIINGVQFESNSHSLGL